MSSELRSLYQEVILDHYKRPRNFGPLEGADRHADGYNPLCGDRVSVHVKLGEDGTIEGVSFEGSGCAISTASASLMTEAVAGKSAQDALALQQRFHKVLTEQNGDVDLSGLGKLEALSGVRDYPVRIKCATLAWHALKAALEGKAETAQRPVSTE
jgi:nitrogen fixation protein NifU and related proteins